LHNAADNLSRLKLRVLAHGEEKGGKACGPPKDGKDVAHFNEEEFEAHDKSNINDKTEMEMVENPGKEDQ